jgi:hypothetical protein
MSKNLEKYLNSTYSGANLLKEHSLHEEGLWQIFGEDPNCDFGGSHHSPELGIVEGKLEDVIAYAVNLPGFWNWGGGGHFKKIPTPIKITPESNYERTKLQQEEESLKEQLEKVQNQLRGIKG